MVSFLQSIDHALFARLNSWHAPWLDTVMLAATHLGVGGFVWLMVAGIASVFPERRAGAWRVALAIGLTSLVVNGMIKPLIWRDRPFAALASSSMEGSSRGGTSMEGTSLEVPAHRSPERAVAIAQTSATVDVRVIDARPRSSSFPSGHAANAVAGAMALSLLFPSVRVLWWTLATLVALSRIYVGVHFPLDVLAGALVGFLCARLVLRHVEATGAAFSPGPVPGA